MQRRPMLTAKHVFGVWMYTASNNTGSAGTTQGATPSGLALKGASSAADDTKLILCTHGPGQLLLLHLSVQSVSVLAISCHAVALQHT
jgi:hypothetical protein